MITELSVTGNVMCQETSFLAVDEESSEPVQGSMQLRQVPVAQAYESLGYDQIGSRHFRHLLEGGVRATRRGALPPPVPPLTFGLSYPCPPAPLPLGIAANAPPALPHRLCFKACPSPPIRSDSSERMRKRTRMLAYDDDDPLLGVTESALGKLVQLGTSGGCAVTQQHTFSMIVSQQRASGAWPMNSTVASLLCKCVADVQMMSQIGQQLSELQTSLWATCIVIAWLEVKCADMKDAWELLADKAKSWIKKQSLPETLTSNDVLSAARKLF